MAIPLMRTWSGPGEIAVDGPTLDRGEREAAEKEAGLRVETESLDARAAALGDRLARIRSRTAQLGRSGNAASFAPQASQLAVPLWRTPAAWSRAAEARAAALRARHEAHAAMERQLASFGPEMQNLEARAQRIEEAVAASEQEIAQTAAERAALARTLIRPRNEGELTRALAKFDTAENAPILLDKPVTQMGSGAERRSHPRVKVHTEVTLESESNFFAGFAEDISAGGLFVATHDYATVGTPVDLTFTIDGEPIRAQAIVRWVRELDDKNPDMPPGMGVMFTSLPEGAQESIVRFVQGREPLFYAD